MQRISAEEDNVKLKEKELDRKIEEEKEKTDELLKEKERLEEEIKERKASITKKTNSLNSSMEELLKGMEEINNYIEKSNNYIAWLKFTNKIVSDKVLHMLLMGAIIAFAGMLTKNKSLFYFYFLMVITQQFINDKAYFKVTKKPVFLIKMMALFILGIICVAGSLAII